MEHNGRSKLIVVCDAEGKTATYVVRETDTELSIEAAIDPRTSGAVAIREMVSLVCAVLPNGVEKFYAFKLLRLVETNVDSLRDRMESTAETSDDDFPF